MSLVETVEDLCLKYLGRRPDLETPTGYNDLIQWLKIHDQRPQHIVACDKWAARNMVAEIAGAGALIPASTDLPPKHYPAILKASHDSGSAVVVRSKFDERRAVTNLSHRLTRPYGVEKGEWAYQFVRPVIIVEDLLDEPVVDYKFHCSHGLVRWVQVIWNRASGKPREAIFLPDGTITDLHMDEKMEHCPVQGAYPGDRAWTELTSLALKLADGWRYVRVDLYWSRGQAWFGELTFWPRAGCYRSQDEPKFGEMLELDLTERRTPIVR